MGTLVNGIKEIFATAKTTGSNVMLCGNDGTPDGHMTMANLASVLGGQYKSLDANIEPDLDNYLNNGYYETAGFSASLFQHAPSGINDSNEAILRVRRIYEQSSFVEQVLFVNNECRYYVRRKRNFWGDWKEMTMDMPLFYKNYSDLSSLATALGVGLFINHGNILSQDYDFRNNAQIGIYHIPGYLGESWKGLTIYSDICVLFNNKTSENPQNYDTIIAIAYDFNAKKLKYYNASTDTFELI